MTPPDDGDEAVPGLPELADPLGPLDFRGRSVGPATGAPFRIPGRRAHVLGTGADGIDEIWTLPFLLVRTLGVRDAIAVDALETPLGVERRLEVAGATIVERVVGHRDAPVVWVEWRAGDAGDGGGPDGSTELEIGWTAILAEPGTTRDDDIEWERLERGARLVRDPVRAVFVFSRRPRDLRVEPARSDAPTHGVRALGVRARVPLPPSGIRLAVVGAAGDDDPGRLLRIADRTGVAVRGREGAVSRLLDGGPAVDTPAGLDRELERARVWLDATRIVGTPGPWTMDGGARRALAHLHLGDFDAARDFLRLLARLAREGRVPDRGVLDRAISYDDDRAGLHFLLLTARYLAWSGNRGAVRALWPTVEDVLDAVGWDGAQADDRGRTGSLRAAALAALAVTAEELGEDATAGALRGEGDRQTAPGDGVGAVPGPSASADTDDPAGTVLRLLGDLAGPRPDAPRGRLELRPRPPARWDRFRVAGLAVGPAALDLEYRRREGEHIVHTFAVRPVRGAVPLQLVLAPELPGGRVVGVRIDGLAAELDVERSGDRHRVPVQLALDGARTLELEIARLSS